MKSNFPKCHFIKPLLLVLLLFPTIVWAQGNDFPGGFQPGVPSWNQPVIPCCSYPQGYWNAYLYGPVRTSQLGVTVRAGDTVRLRYKIDWYGFAIVTTSVNSGSEPWAVDAQNMRYTGPNSGASQQEQWNWGPLGWFCFDCGWDFEAGSDDPYIWVDCAGSCGSLGMHLEIREVVPRSNRGFSIMPEISKETYHNVGAGLISAGAASALMAQWARGIGDAHTAGILGGAGVIAGFVGGYLRTVDPWDDWYGYPYEPVFKSPSELGLEYLPTWWGDWFLDDVSNENNNLVNAGIAMDAYLKAALVSVDRAMSCAQITAGCEEWQAERARQFFEAANYHAYWAAVALYNLEYYYGAIGLYDYNGSFNELLQLFWGMYSNSVR